MSELLAKCKICQSLLDEEDMFCANCGTPLTWEGVSALCRRLEPLLGGREAFVEVERAGVHQLRIETPNTVEVRLAIPEGLDPAFWKPSADDVVAMQQADLLFAVGARFDDRVTGKVAGGSNLVMFTTGRGSCFGCKPSPVIKIASNSPLFEALDERYDYGILRCMLAELCG